MPENRDIDKIFEMIHYENNNEQFYEIRKDSFQNKDITDYKNDKSKHMSCVT